MLQMQPVSQVATADEGGYVRTQANTASSVAFGQGIC